MHTIWSAFLIVLLLAQLVVPVVSIRRWKWRGIGYSLALTAMSHLIFDSIYIPISKAMYGFHPDPKLGDPYIFVAFTLFYLSMVYCLAAIVIAGIIEACFGKKQNLDERKPTV